MIIDIGCGPGSITAGLASLVPEGKVEGGDIGETVLVQARKLAESRNLNNVNFSVMNANDLPFPDAHFDVAFCHQILQHVRDPVAVLREMRRVVKPGGIIAARETDYKSFSWYPELPGIDKWSVLYQKAARASGGEPNAGRRLHVWAREAGFEPQSIQATWTSWRFSGTEAVQVGESWAARTLNSNTADVVREHGLASDMELNEISETWKQWATQEDLLMIIPNGEILCQK